MRCIFLAPCNFLSGLPMRPFKTVVKKEAEGALQSRRFSLTYRDSSVPESITSELAKKEEKR